MRSPVPRPVMLGLVLFTLALAACGDDDSVAAPAAPTATPTATPVPLTSADVLAPGPFAVGVTTLTFEDTSRPTMANGTFPGSASRVLTTEIWYPVDAAGTGDGSGGDRRDAAVAAVGRPYPLVIYSHGFTSNRRGGAFIARHLAGHGYVVASADYPLTSDHALGNRPNGADLAEQPADVRFLIDRLLALGADGQSRFAGAVDAARIGLTGLSLGGSTTLLTSFSAPLRDPRIRAAAPIAAGACWYTSRFYESAQVPLLLLHGDIDAIVPFAEHAAFAFEQARPPKYLVAIAGGTHTSFTDGADTIFENAKNADDLGCRALTGSVSEDGPDSDLLAFLDRLGGSSAGVVPGDCPRICQGTRPRSIRPSRQHQLTLLTLLPFFESTLRGDTRAREFLDATLATENPDVQVRFRH